jgi:hypothetical protein
MKLQFSVRALFLATAIAGLWMGGVLAIPLVVAITSRESIDTYRHLDPAWCAISAASFAPIWVPAVFLAYAIGRRKLTAKFVLVFAVGVALALGIVAIGFVWASWRIRRIS